MEAGRRKGNVAAALLCAGAVMAVLCVMLACFLRTSAEEHLTSSLCGMITLAQEEWDALSESLETAEMNPEDLLFDEAGLAYMDAAYTAAGCTFYVPQDPDTPLWNGLFRAAGGEQLYILEDAYLQDKAAAIQDGHLFQCMITDGQTARYFALIMVGTPTVSIDYDNSTLVREEDRDGRLQVRGTDGSYTASDIAFHVRGAASFELEKKSYKITLKTQEGDNKALSLCGMRDDDDWILYAMYRDQTRFREPLGYQVWSVMEALSGNTPQTTQMVCVAVFFNNEYMGMYALMEPVDAKTFELDEGDLLYKITDTQIEPYVADADGGGAEIKWPKEPRADDWDVLQYCYQFIAGEMTWEELEAAGVRLDTENMTRYELFVELLYATDNSWKNQFLVCRLQEDGTYVVTESPWDLNGSFGDDPDGMFKQERALRESLHSDLYTAWVRDCPEEAQASLAQTWCRLRDDGLSADSVCAQASLLWTSMLESGGVLREADRWPGTVDGNNYDETLEWIRTRFTFMDELYGYQAE